MAVERANLSWVEGIHGLAVREHVVQRLNLVCKHLLRRSKSQRISSKSPWTIRQHRRHVEQAGGEVVVRALIKLQCPIGAAKFEATSTTEAIREASAIYALQQRTKAGLQTPHAHLRFEVDAGWLVVPCRVPASRSTGADQQESHHQHQNPRLRHAAPNLHDHARVCRCLPVLLYAVELVLKTSLTWPRQCVADCRPRHLWATALDADWTRRRGVSGAYQMLGDGQRALQTCSKRRSQILTGTVPSPAPMIHCVVLCRDPSSCAASSQ